MANSIRSRAPADIRLERFYEASQSPDTRLTHTAVIGERKQSVEDAERFFSPFVRDWMLAKGYEAEAKRKRSSWMSATAQNSPLLAR